ncbi:MAG: alpha/beta hydrolase [Flavobacteriaceae bacterium]|nr:alpha/beta hydrolase [Flavobacteriaceae bacterium]|tara:strand:+ start:171352 stop:173784 length:2433 start_codon:yes stop_codon:yes gene_type:complete
MKKKYQQIVQWFKFQIQKITPGKNAEKGAALGLLTATLILWFIYGIRISINIGDPYVVLFTLVLLAAAVLLGYLGRWGVRQIGSIPELYKLALLISIPLLMTMSFNWILPVVILILASLIGAGYLVVKKTGFKKLTKVKKVITLLGIGIGLGGFITLGVFYGGSGIEMDPIKNAALSSDISIENIKAISPAQKGPFTVKTLSYGSGKDKHRSEFAEEVTIKTDSVNGVAFIDNWEGFSGWWRTKYWGFDSKALPINGRVWYPEGDGPFPLVLIVHGNHLMQDYSDVGYGYLGELLASKGMIAVSVDENFINGSWTDLFGGLEKENDARGWLLLEHLRVWHEWNKNEGNPFFKKLDTNKLALIGHSRGGEAVGHAAMFNQLPHYPDDASIKFDYNYNIKSIVAIAPVDGQYKPGGSRTAFKDVDYFVIHGAQDADVSSYAGSQQYERIKFKDSLYHFKSGLYVYGANHGQFNTSWGNNDSSNPFTGLLNLKQQLSKEDQEQIAKVYIGSFLDVTLNDKKEYLPLFIDARKGKDWLPETIYLNQFEDTNFKPIAHFDEDFDVITTHNKDVKISTENLKVWREAEIRLKWGNKGSRALFAGWNYELKKNDSISSVPDSLIAKYRIENPTIEIDSSSVLVFSMAESKESSNPKSSGKWINKSDNDEDEDEDEGKEGEKEEETKNENEDEKETAKLSKEEEVEDEEEDDEKEKKAKEPIDFSIQLIDSKGQKASLPISSFSGLQRSIEVSYLKTDYITDEKESEKVFQTFYFPMESFSKANPNFDMTTLQKIEFVFDKSKSGVVVIDNIGLMKKL